MNQSPNPTQRGGLVIFACFQNYYWDPYGWKDHFAYFGHVGFVLTN